MGDIRSYWGCDHAPGTGQITTFTTAGQLTQTKIYFEVQVVSGISGNNAACLGICGSSFILTAPDKLDVSPPDPSSFAQCVALELKTGGSTPVGRGYPNNIPGSGTFALNDWFGIAVDTATSLLWYRNATAASSTWYGDSGILTPDPVAEVQGWSFDAALGKTPITGNIYVVIGGGNENSGSSQVVNVNFGASGFAAAAPSGYVSFNTAAGTTTLNASDADSHITLAGGNLGITGITAIAGGNQPTGWVRSTKFVTR